MLLDISGLNSMLGLRLIDATRSQQIDQLRQEPRNQRALEAFVAEIGTIATPAELVENFEVYSFVMRAFDLEDQIFGRGMMRKVLESDPSDDESLVNRLTDSRFQIMHEEMGFTVAPGQTPPDFNDLAWQQSIINRFFDQTFENGAADQNGTVGSVLKLRRQAPTLNNWFDVLKDKELTTFFRTALGLPDAMASVPLDRQKSIFEEKFDLSTLNDPEVQDRLISRFVAVSDVANAQGVTQSAALSVLQNRGGLGVIVSLNVPQVSFSASSLYR